MLLGKLRQAGIYVALDDFGCWLAAASTIFNLPDISRLTGPLPAADPDWISNLRCWNLLWEMARINDLMVVAEGVETLRRKGDNHPAGVAV